MDSHQAQANGHEVLASSSFNFGSVFRYLFGGQCCVQSSNNNSNFRNEGRKNERLSLSLPLSLSSSVSWWKETNKEIICEALFRPPKPTALYKSHWNLKGSFRQNTQFYRAVYSVDSICLGQSVVVPMTLNENHGNRPESAVPEQHTHYVWHWFRGHSIVPSRVLGQVGACAAFFYSPNWPIYRNRIKHTHVLCAACFMLPLLLQLFM